MNASPSLALYYAPFTCSLVAYIALTEAAAEFDVRVVDVRRGEQLRAEFLALNAKHRVPVLLVDGVPLTENIAIMLWVARHFPTAGLLPPGELDEARAISLLSWCASGIHAFLTPNVLPQRYCDLPGSEESVRRCAHLQLKESFAIADAQLKGRTWFFEHFSLPDIHFFWCFRRARQLEVDLAPFAACHEHFARMSERASVRKLVAFEAETLAGLASSATTAAPPTSPQP